MIRLLLIALVALLVAPQVAHADACAEGRGPGCRPLAEPVSPQDDPAEVLAELGSSASPVDDLEAAIRRLGTAEESTRVRAVAARAEALAILEGTPLDGKPYSGIPLLNWNAPAKVKRVPAGGTVEVREVRYPDHAVSDTGLLEFDDPTKPYTLRFRISELGGATGGELKPAALLADGATRLASTHHAVRPLIPPALATGTFAASRFTEKRNLRSGAPESTRTAEQTIEVQMPAPRLTHAVLAPDTRPRGTSLLTFQPATPERLAAAEQAFGFSTSTPSEADRVGAIERLAVAAPERQIWDELRALAPDAPSFVTDARHLADQLGELVDAMRTRGALPAGVGADPDADLTLVLQNNETYVSRARLRPAAGGRVRVRVHNRDGFAHRVTAMALHGRRPNRGANDWGVFDWTPLTGQRISEGSSAIVEVTVPADAFALWVGDADTGDQAAHLVELDQGPRTTSITPGATPADAPLHQATDAQGDRWLTLSGSDSVMRFSPRDDLERSPRTVHRIPGGRHTATSAAAPLEPADIGVDHRGVVWTTLLLGNGIARLDPAKLADGTTAGVSVYSLPACDEEECPPVFPPEPGARPTREPLQLEIGEDADGNTLVWFTEANVNRIGLLRVAPDGRMLGQTHYSCGCRVPLGLALDQGGDVWFTEAVDNRLGRLTLDVTEPFAAAAARLRHYRIPSAELVDEPELAPAPVLTSNPHSVAVDRRGLVWFTESATSKLGYLDPDLARPDTTEGVTEIALGTTEFGTDAAPADLVIDRAGTVFWTDEYGDVVGSVVTAGARASWRTGRSVRPTARRSLTDSPLVDPDGSLWFLETAANRLTRVEGVSAGNPLVPARIRVEADLSADVLSLEGAPEATAIDVEVSRGEHVVARAEGAPVADGAARISAWGASDALRSGDRLRVTLRGAHLPTALATVLPRLEASASDGGAQGIALLGDRPLPGTVTAGQAAAAIGADGHFSLSGAAAAVTWSTVTPGARWTTRVAVAGAAPDPPAPAATPTPTPSAPATTPAPPPATEPSPRVADPPPAAEPTPRVADPPSACRRRWLVAGRPALLRLRSDRLPACLGRLERKRGAVSRFPSGVELTMRGGRVAAMVVSQPGWTSDAGGLAVGAPARTVTRALPGARLDRRLGVRRAIVTLARGRVADIRVVVTRDRVRRIEAHDRAVSELDAFGRGLLRARR